MYGVILALHNILRWVVLILALIALVRSFRGWLGNQDWTEQDRKAGLFFTIGLDIQFLLGLILYFFLSPFALPGILKNGLQYMLSQPEDRFFSLVHILYMLLAVVFGHLGSILPRKAQNALAKHQRAAIFFTLAVLALLLGIPWWRRLFPGL